MKNLKKPEINDTAAFDNIVKRNRRKTHLGDEMYRQRILYRYSYYDNHKKHLNDITPLNETVWRKVKDELIQCYQGNSMIMRAIRREVLDDVCKCPYCGVNDPDTLDHYFDKKEYPEFSIYSPNLIPCCHSCNNRKGTKVFNQNHQRQYLHFYFDTIPDYQFIFIRFFADNGIPRIKISLRFQKDEPSQCVIRNHFKSLELISKYRDVAGKKLSVIIDTLKNLHDSGESVDEIRKYLTSYYNALVKNRGANYIETVIYEGVLNSKDFIEKFSKKALE